MLTNALDSLFARLYEPMMAKMESEGLAEQRAQLLGGLGGDVLEIGAGTGLNLPAYPATLGSLTLAEPTRQMVSQLRGKGAQVRPDATIVEAQMQTVVAPIQRVMGRGCHLTRDIRTAMADAGFDVGSVVSGEIKAAPPIVRTIVSGVATAT